MSHYMLSSRSAMIVSSSIEPMLIRCFVVSGGKRSRLEERRNAMPAEAPQGRPRGSSRQSPATGRQASGEGGVHDYPGRGGRVRFCKAGGGQRGPDRVAGPGGGIVRD
eukprot:scaffold76814_cov30-Prasinocladus_malaysianus.AAC.2